MTPKKLTPERKKAALRFRAIARRLRARARDAEAKADASEEE